MPQPVQSSLASELFNHHFQWSEEANVMCGYPHWIVSVRTPISQAMLFSTGAKGMKHHKISTCHVTLRQQVRWRKSYSCIRYWPYQANPPWPTGLESLKKYMYNMPKYTLLSCVSKKNKEKKKKMLIHVNANKSWMPSPYEHLGVLAPTSKTMHVQAVHPGDVFPELIQRALLFCTQ